MTQEFVFNASVCHGVKYKYTLRETKRNTTSTASKKNEVMCRCLEYNYKNSPGSILTDHLAEWPVTLSKSLASRKAGKNMLQNDEL